MKLFLSQLPDIVQKLPGRVKTIEEKLSAFETEVDEQIEDIRLKHGNEIKSLRESDEATGKDLASLHKEIENILKQLEEVNALMAISQAEFTMLQNQANESSKAIETMNVSIKEIHELLTGLQTQVTGLKDRIVILEANQLNIAVQNLSLADMDENPIKTGIQLSKDLPLPITTANGGEITWTSSNIDVVSNEGRVSQPSYTDGDTIVTLTAHITYGEKVLTKDFEINVLAAAATDIERVTEDKAQLTIVTLDDMPDLEGIQILGNKSLPRIGGKHQTAITWTSDNPAVFNGDGIVSRPAYNTTNAIVNLTATIKSGLITETKQFAVTVIKADPTDAEKVMEDKGVLALGITEAISDIALPVRGSLYDSAITWTSTKPEFISTEGKVIRPSHTAGNQIVTLRALIKSGAASDYKEFNISIPALPPISKEKADADLTAITLPNSTDKDIVLPTVGQTYGSEITWVSLDSEHLTDTGIVTRPTYSEGDVIVQMDVTVKQGESISTKSFHVTVKYDPTSMTAQDKVNEDIKALTLAHLDENSTKPGIQVTKTIVLPDKGPLYGSAITWVSSNPSIITNAGIVNSPAPSIGDKTVTMTATATLDGLTATKGIAIVAVANNN